MSGAHRILIPSGRRCARRCIRCSLKCALFCCHACSELLLIAWDGWCYILFDPCMHVRWMQICRQTVPNCKVGAKLPKQQASCMHIRNYILESVAQHPHTLLIGKDTMSMQTIQELSTRVNAQLQEIDRKKCAFLRKAEAAPLALMIPLRHGMHMFGGCSASYWSCHDTG